MPLDEDIPARSLVEARLSSILIDDQTLDAILELVAALAETTIPSVAGVGVSLMRDGEVVTTAHTDEFVKTLDGLQYETDEGPCLDAMRSGNAVEVPNLQTDERWPAFRRGAVEHGVLSSLSLPLKARDRALGVLNLYARALDGFDGSRDVADAFARHASVVVANAEAYSSASSLNQNLREAVKTRDLIGQAKGILMERERCTADEAFDLLRRVSQEKNVKLRDVAQQIVDELTRRNALTPPGPADAMRGSR